MNADTMPQKSRERDFSAEIEALDKLTDSRVDIAGELVPPPFEDASAFFQFYRQADQEFQKERFPKKKRRPLYVRFKSYHDLPSSPRSHIRGYIEGNRYYVLRREKNDDWMLSRKVHECTFHSLPTDETDSDIPTNEDIFDFLKFGYHRQVIVGANHISILDKNLETLQRSLELWRWEAKHRYKLVRVERRHPEKTAQQHRERYAKIALRGLGLRWPYRKHEVRKQWVEILNDFGVPVQQLAVIEPTHSKAETVLSILTGEATLQDAAKWHGVSERTVKEWKKLFIKAGKAALESLRNA